MELIKVKIDVIKITKAKLYKGEKGTYLNCTLVPTPNSEHSDWMVVEETSKDEREKGNKGAILGNASVIKKKEQTNSTVSDAQVIPEEPTDDLPF